MVLSLKQGFISADPPSYQFEDVLVAAEEEPVPKLEFESTSDFKFKAAYEAYSKAFERAKGAEERRRLNSKISDLFENKISYVSFYSEVNQYLGDDGRSKGYDRVRIQTKSKREYRREEQKKERIARYKK